jgi:hypothetical protein
LHSSEKTPNFAAELEKVDTDVVEKWRAAQVATPNFLPAKNEK